MQIKKILTVGIFSLLAFSFLSILTVQAANIVDVNFPCPGSDIPGFPKCERQPDGVPTNDFVGYMLQAYQFGIGIVGIIAVGMIVYGGILIAWNTESIDKRGKGREMITSALIGIAVLFGSYLILNTINPELVKFNLGRNLPTSTSIGFIDNAKKSLGSLQNLCGTGGDPSTITRWPNFTESPSCEYRKMTYKGTGGLEIGNDGRYYDEWEAEKITPNSMIWSYPYFITEEGTSTARCLIYAYRDLNTEKSPIVKIDLDNDLSICTLDPEIKMKSESDTAGGECKDCVELEKNSSISVKPGICVKNSGICLVNKDLQWKLNNLAREIADWRVTEAYPPDVVHKSFCHNNGTCVDANFNSPLGSSSYEQSDARKIENFFNKALDLNVIYEVGDSDKHFRLKAITVAEHKSKIIFNNGVADHFHISN